MNVLPLGMLIFTSYLLQLFSKKLLYIFLVSTRYFHRYVNEVKITFFSDSKASTNSKSRQQQFLQNENFKYLLKNVKSFNTRLTFISNLLFHFRANSCLNFSGGKIRKFSSHTPKSYFHPRCISIAEMSDETFHGKKSFFTRHMSHFLLHLAFKAF